MFTHNRRGIDLNGTWKFCPDPMQRCRRQRWWKGEADIHANFPSWDMKGLWDTTVPSTWKMEFEKLEWYNGHAVYVRDFTIEDASVVGGEAFLCFDGVLYDSEVYLNGQFIGKNSVGYTPFSFRVTELLQKENRLFVLVNNTLTNDRVPGDSTDWENDGGIINPVKLIFTPVVHIENFKTETRLDGEVVNIDIDLSLTARDSSGSEMVTVAIPELGFTKEIEVTVDSPARIGFQLQRSDIVLWSPENPKLYDVEITTPFETVRDEVGFREIKRVGRDILLNGEELRLYGISVHAEFKDTGRAATPEGIELMIQKAKELGVNFLRCAHYPYSEAFGRAMDRAGLLWWEEVPVYWMADMDRPLKIDMACNMLRDMIKRDWNRASLIIWSVSNECCYRNPDNFDENNYAYWFESAALVRSLDSSRLLSCAEAGNMISVSPIWDPDCGDEFKRSIDEVDSWRPGHTDEWYKLFDILAANIYVEAGQSLTAYTQFVNMLRRYNKPLMLSEFGQFSLRGAEVLEGTLGGEHYHATVLREAYEAFEQLPELKGYSPWVLTDIRVPTHWRWYNTGKGVFRYGIFDENWVKKELVFETLKKSVARIKQVFA